MFQGHSAEVELWLDYANYGSARLRRVGPTYAEMWEGFDAPPGEGILRIRIDAKWRTHRVRLPDGVSKDNTMVAVFPWNDPVPF